MIYKSTDYSNLSSVPASTGDVIEVYGNFNAGTGILSSGVHIHGKTPDAAIIGGGQYTTTPAIKVVSGTNYLKDLKFQNS